mgnify:CR=1 FL=1|tara:strand:- start:25 stop:1335 length:1311 start_codon:yes stop_codon:yes gene_type:complete
MKWLLLPVALTISAIAAYYSIYGLVAIFAAAVIPIIIMGVALEIGKLVSVVYLHQYWENTRLLLKSYLIAAVALLMFITSLGIFGFLSKAHIEQASLSEEQIALIDTLEDKEIRSELKIERWEKELVKLLNNEDTRVDTLIGNEQEQLNNIYDRIEREKNSANEAYNTKVKTINETITGFGSNNRKAEQIEIANDELKKAIEDIDAKYKDEIKELQDVIKGYRNQVTEKTGDIDNKIEELETRIESEQKIIDAVVEEKAVYEKEYRKLEAEVGPIKYIAELIYGETNRGLLEDAVRWVIIVLVIVFDPLAVALLIAWNDIIKRESPRPKPIPQKPEPDEPEKKTEEVEDKLVDEPDVEKDYEKDSYYNNLGLKVKANPKTLKEFMEETPDFFAQLADEMGGRIDYDSDAAQIDVPDDVLEQLPDGTYRKKVSRTRI